MNNKLMNLSVTINQFEIGDGVDEYFINENKISLKFFLSRLDKYSLPDEIIDSCYCRIPVDVKVKYLDGKEFTKKCLIAQIEYKHRAFEIDQILIELKVILI